MSDDADATPAPAVRDPTDLVPLEAPGRGLRAAAQGGALRAGLPVALVLASLPFWIAPACYGALGLMKAAGLGGATRFFALNAGLFLAAAGGVGLLSRALAPYIRDRSIRSRDEGRAAVAGIALATAALGLLAIPVAGWIQGRMLLLEVGLRFLAVALGVGYLGAHGFQVAAEARGERVQLPVLYQGARAAGTSVVSGLVLGVGWSVAAGFLPFLAPTFLATLLLGAGVGTLAASLAITFAATAPLAYMVAATQAPSDAPGARGAVAAGVAAPATLLALWAFVKLAGVSLGSIAGMGVLGAWALHAAAAWAGARPGRGRTRLPAGADPDA